MIIGSARDTMDAKAYEAMMGAAAQKMAVHTIRDEMYRHDDGALCIESGVCNSPGISVIEVWRSKLRFTNSFPAPVYGCRWCGAVPRKHGIDCLPWRKKVTGYCTNMYTLPTEAQILARRAHHERLHPGQHHSESEQCNALLDGVMNHISDKYRGMFQ